MEIELSFFSQPTADEEEDVEMAVAANEEQQEAAEVKTEVEAEVKEEKMDEDKPAVADEKKAEVKTEAKETDGKTPKALSPSLFRNA